MKHSLRGASLLDSVVGSAIFLVIMTGLWGVLRLSIREATESKARLGALMLANEHIEFLHSFGYVSVSVGATQVQQTLNDIVYTRDTLVQYVDDPKDGLGALDHDATPNDYKKIKVKVSWASHGLTRSVSLVSNVVPEL